VRAHEPVRDLVQGAVPADGDDELRAVGGGALGELREVPGAGREEGLAGEAELRGAMCELRPAPAGGAVRGRRVDEEDRVNGLR